MKRLLFIFTALTSMTTHARAEIKTGDILLESLPCFMCSLIELEEESAYSHAGIAIVEGNRISVLESWQKVERVSLDRFLQKRKKKTRTLVMRPIDRNGNEVEFSNSILLEAFEREFNGKSYDSEFLWNNRDEHGEKFYCSEFIAKLMNRFLPISFSTKPMHFQKYRDYWIQYFKGTPPDGVLGISPGDFEKSSLLKPIEQI